MEANVDLIEMEKVANSAVYQVNKETITNYKKLIAAPLLQDDGYAICSTGHLVVPRDDRVTCNMDYISKVLSSIHTISELEFSL